MTPALKQAAARGGRATAKTSKAKAAALKALHDSRRGVRSRPDDRQREIVLGELASLLRERVRGVVSIRVAAQYCRISDRTLRRWLSGEDWPPATQIRRLAEWTRSRRRP